MADESQMPRRTAHTIAQSEDSQKTEGSSEKSKPGKHPNSLANLKPFKPGAEWTGNRGGRKRDLAADLCRAIIEGNPTLVYESMAKEIAKGSAYAFQVVSDRAYGKLKQTNVHVGDEEGGPIDQNITVTFVRPK